MNAAEREARDQTWQKAREGGLSRSLDAVDAFDAGWAAGSEWQARRVLEWLRGDESKEIIRYCIDKSCTGGTDEDLVAAHYAVDEMAAHFEDQPSRGSVRP